MNIVQPPLLHSGMLPSPSAYWPFWKHRSNKSEKEAKRKGMIIENAMTAEIGEANEAPTPS
jgi:hypothetical protein